MKPAGIIKTYMDLKKVLKWWFNIPLLVFQLIFMIVGTLTLSFVWAVQGMTGADVDTQKAVERAAIYASPIVYLLGQVLALYSIPWCFRGRERGEWTPHIVPALSFFRSHRTESRQLLLPLVIGAVLGAVFIHSQGVGDERTDPDMVIIGLLMLTQSYLWLTAVHGACVVVLSSAGERRGQNEE